MKNTLWYMLLDLSYYNVILRTDMSLFKPAFPKKFVDGAYHQITQGIV